VSSVRILRALYGESVKPDNVESPMAQPDVGGAQLKGDSFLEVEPATRGSARRLVRDPGQDAGGSSPTPGRYGRSVDLVTLRSRPARHPEELRPGRATKGPPARRR
jgi:hypothetical protein